MTPLARVAARSAEELLRDREVQGLRAALAFRVFFVVAGLALTLLVGVSSLEKLAMGVWTVFAGAVLAWYLWMLARRRRLLLIGVVGALLDVVFLALLPWIWYASVGGSENVPSTFLLKVQTWTAVSLLVVAVNCLAARPVYPLLVTAGAVVVHLALLGVVLRDPRTVLTSDPVEHVLGAGLNPQFFGVVVFILASAGFTLTWFAASARKTILQAVRLERSTEQARRYFSPEVFERILNAPLPGGGRSQPVAVLFCDIRDFTALGDRFPPEEIVRQLADYHGRMTKAVFAHRGTLDKFLGDGLMATVGTPDPGPDDAERAVRIGVAMRGALRELNAERERRGLPPLRHGVGVHFGDVVAGNIGTEERLEYTVIGDPVNVASRIQHACKELGEDLLLSEAVASRVAGAFRLRDVGEVQLAGKAQPLRLFAVDG